MKKHSIVNLKCPCFLFRHPNLDIPSQALFHLHRASALPLKCNSEDDQNFQSLPGHSRRRIRRRRYCMVPVWHSAMCEKPLKKWNLELASPSEDYSIFLCLSLKFLIVNPLILQNTFWSYKILASFSTIFKLGLSAKASL